jgi:hypothetical protein
MQMFLKTVRLFSFRPKIFSMKQYLSCVVLCLTALVACNKVSVPTSTEEELRAGNWYLEAATVHVVTYLGEDTLITLLHKDVPECMKDGYFVFDMNYKGKNINPKLCNSTEAPEALFRWELFPNDSGIHIWDASETMLSTKFIAGGADDIKSPFLDYDPNRFSINHIKQLKHTIDTTWIDTYTYKFTFVKR